MTMRCGIHQQMYQKTTNNQSAQKIMSGLRVMMNQIVKWRTIFGYEEVLIG